MIRRTRGHRGHRRCGLRVPQASGDTVHADVLVTRHQELEIRTKLLKGIHQEQTVHGQRHVQIRRFLRQSGLHPGHLQFRDATTPRLEFEGHLIDEELYHDRVVLGATLVLAALFLFQFSLVLQGVIDDAWTRPGGDLLHQLTDQSNRLDLLFVDVKDEFREVAGYRDRGVVGVSGRDHAPLDLQGNVEPLQEVQTGGYPGASVLPVVLDPAHDDLEVREVDRVVVVEFVVQGHFRQGLVHLDGRGCAVLLTPRGRRAGCLEPLQLFVVVVVFAGGGGQGDVFSDVDVVGQLQSAKVDDDDGRVGVCELFDEQYLRSGDVELQVPARPVVEVAFEDLFPVLEQASLGATFHCLEFPIR